MRIVPCKRKSTDVMLDSETTGVSAGCGILSIGACTFDEKDLFYRKIDLSTCHAVGLKDRMDTLDWWGKQSAEARMEAFSGTLSLQEVLGEFADFMRGLEGIYPNGVYLWGNGADFDLPILGAAYEACDMKKPWGPFNGRCYRTVKNLKENKEIKAPAFEGVKHNALADAIHQARHMMLILRKGSKE